MKPLGTITMCFPHVDEKVTGLLSSVMNRAKNYADFIEQLCYYVSSEDSSPLLSYLAFYHAFHISDYALVESLEKACEISLLAKPLHMITQYRRGVLITWEQMESAIRSALEVAPNDWISCHLYLKWRYYTEFNMPETDSNVSLLDTISEDVNKRQEFDFFKTYLLRLDALRHHYDMELDQQIQLMEKALFIAKKHDEQVVVADLQSGLANVVKHFNMKRAIGYLDSSREISEQLGYRYNLGHIHQELGHIAGIRGEYDSAIDHFIEFQHVRESLKLPITMTKYLLATYCNLARNGEAALSAIEEAISSYESVRKISPYALIQRAWALTNLGQYGIAREELEASQEIAFKSGVVWYTSIWPKLVEGILEKVEGNYDEAKAIFEGVLDKFGHKPIPLVQNVCYLNLAEIEIELTKVDSLARPDGISGPWMEKLEEYVEENQLPGIRAQMLLLKASLYQRLGLFDETRELIQECRMLAESKGLDYLQRITNQLQLSLETKTRKDD